MSAPRRRPFTRPLIGILLVLLILGAAGGLLFTLPRRPAPPAPRLPDLAQMGTWQALAAPTPLTNPQGYHESDFLNIDGQYYLFATGSQDPAWVDVYVGRTPMELVNSAPRFTHVAPIRYPTVVKVGQTWHMWGVNPPHRWTEHWISNNPDPTGFIYSDSPFRETAQGIGRNLDPADVTHTTSRISTMPVVDFAVRQSPATGDWYGVGFETEDNAPLLLTRSPTPNGPWERLNYVPNSHAGGIFGDSGPPVWATAARFDPALVFTPDGRAWALFTGRAPAPGPTPTPLDQSGMVEVNIATGKAIGQAVVVFDPRDHPELPFALAADLNLIAVPGQPDRLLGYTDNPRFPLAELDLSDFRSLLDNRGN